MSEPESAFVRLPRTHRGHAGRFAARTKAGTAFSLSISPVRRRRGGHDLIRAHMRATARGRPMSHGDLYAETTEIALLVADRVRVDIRIRLDGSYEASSCRESGRDLRDLVARIVARHEREHDAGGPLPGLPGRSPPALR